MLNDRQPADPPESMAPPEHRTLRVALEGQEARGSCEPTAPLRCGELAGETIGHYRVKELIGRGSFGDVYRAVDPRLDRDVAVKVAEPGIARDPQSRELFWNEARIQARLEHSNIVPIYDILDDSGQLAIVMRLIHGADLDMRLRQMVRPFTPAETLRLMRQVASAVGAAHERGVIHQDLKPGNIRLTPNAEAVVLDFGVARITGQAAPDTPGMAGTPSYMSPEQIRGDAIDARSDIYAFAMTLYKTLTGHHPFEDATSLAELLSWQLERAPASPTRYNPNIPEALAKAILRGLAKDPKDRYRGCAEFTAAVCTALGVEEALPDTGPDARWNPRAAVSLAATVQLTGDAQVEARIVDLSTTGAAVRLPVPVEAGSRAGLVIRIPLRKSEHLVRCTMRVRRTMPQDDATFTHVGVEFEGIGNFDRAVLADFVRAVLIHHRSV